MAKAHLIPLRIQTKSHGALKHLISIHFHHDSSPFQPKITKQKKNKHMGVSENSVPLHPMVLLIMIPITNGYFIGNINPTFSDKPTSFYAQSQPHDVPAQRAVASPRFAALPRHHGVQKCLGAAQAQRLVLLCQPRQSAALDCAGYSLIDLN